MSLVWFMEGIKKTRTFYGQADHKRPALILTTTKRAWKMNFWDPSQWGKMCFECQRIKFQWKKDKKMHIFYDQGRCSWSLPSPPFGQPNRKKLIYFVDLLHFNFARLNPLHSINNRASSHYIMSSWNWHIWGETKTATHVLGLSGTFCSLLVFTKRAFFEMAMCTTLPPSHVCIWETKNHTFSNPTLPWRIGKSRD